MYLREFRKLGTLVAIMALLVCSTILRLKRTLSLLKSGYSLMCFPHGLPHLVSMMHLPSEAHDSS